jgi:hypothetical protein
LWIIVCYTERVAVNHGVLYESSGCKSLSIAQHDSQLLCSA